MRVFSVEPDGGFTEYEQLPFETDHAEADLEQWLEANPGGILEDGPMLIIGRQVPTDLDKSIDRAVPGPRGGRRSRSRCWLPPRLRSTAR